MSADVDDVPSDAVIAATMLALIEARAPGATICPSDVARRLMPDDEPAWRASMDAIRSVAADLVATGRVRVTRQGRDVDARTPGGPIRIGRPHRAESSSER